MAFPRLPLLPIILATVLATACDDPLSPELRRGFGLEALEDRRLRSIADGVLELPMENLILFPAAEIVVEQDGEWLSFRAIVIETVFEPDTGHSGAFPRGRRYLRAWRPDVPTEVFVMGGAQLPGPMGAQLLEGEPSSAWGYRPQMWAQLDARSVRSAFGTAELAVVTVGDPCPWTKVALTRNHAAGDSLMRCDHAEYAVGFQATLRQRDSVGTIVGERVEVRMMTQRVPGIRVTLTCNRSALAEQLGCGQLPTPYVPPESSGE